MYDLQEQEPVVLPRALDYLTNQAYVWAYEELRSRHHHEFAELFQQRHRVLVDAENRSKTDIDGQRFEQVLVLASRLCDVPIEAMVGRSRTRGTVRGRMVAMWGARQFTALSYPQIAHRFERDHTTVINAVQRVDALLAGKDQTYCQLIDQLRVAMRSHLAAVEAA